VEDLLACEIVGEQGEAEAAPGELRLVAERCERLGDGGEAFGVEPRQATGERGAAFLGIQLSREALGGHGVEVELAVRVAAGREYEERPAASGVQLVVVDRHLAEHEPDECDEQLARVRLEPRGLELF
jgi:hypothetical protein